MLLFVNHLSLFTRDLLWVGGWVALIVQAANKVEMFLGSSMLVLGEMP